MSESIEANGVEVTRDGTFLTLNLSGKWSIFSERSGFSEVLSAVEARSEIEGIIVDCSTVTEWDSWLLAFLTAARTACEREGWEFRPAGLPAGVKKLLEQVPKGAGEVTGKKEEKRSSLFSGEFLTRVGRGTEEIFRFTGEVVLSALRLLAPSRRFRWGDSLEAMQQTGAMALPIVGLISFLVGVIMAFQAAIQLRQFGADVFVANLVGLAVVREMGPMMAAVVLCGRTGAAFAAQIGTMKVNEEIDALRTLGVSPIDFLVMPRMVALFVMMPLLAIYADVLGIFGGLFVATTVMDILPGSYLNQTQEAITLSDAFSGLIKAVAFGFLIAFAGCLRGLQCKRSSAGVGAAATSAVVTGILLVIVADALFAVIFNRLGI